MEHMQEHWRALDIKTRIAYITALAAFAAGWGLTIAAFIVGKGQIHDSVLWVLGQALVYTASVLGIGMYINGEVKSMRAAVQDFTKGKTDESNG